MSFLSFTSKNGRTSNVFSANFIGYSSDPSNIQVNALKIPIHKSIAIKIIEIEPDISISAAKNIIGLRNIISHSYDSVEPELLWGIIQQNIPVLSLEISRILELK